MTKLISGRIAKVPSANVSADRYQFIELSETEPDLGLPSQLGQIFTSDLSGNRYWVRLDTANVSETTNQYFTNVRVLQAVDPRLTTSNVSELTNLYFTPERAIAALQGNNVTVNNLTVSGDLEVQGNLVSINTTTLNVEDKNILLANGAVNSAAADGAGLTIAGANAQITYTNAGDLFDINKNVNVQGNISLTGTIQSATDLYVNVDTKSWKFDTNGDLTVPNYVNFKGGTFVGDEPGAGTPTFRLVAPLGYGTTIETDSDISGNNYVWTFGKDGFTNIPGSLNAQGNVIIDGTFIGNGLIIRNIAVTDEILTGNILGQGFTSNTIVVSETLTANIITANSITATEWNGIYTSNVIESPNRLYYTNDRVFSFVTGMSIGDLVDVANIYTYPISNAVVGIQLGQALVWDGNIFIPTFVNSEVANVADLAVRVLSLEGQTTANVAEAASNLYFTNTRVLDAISQSTIRPYDIFAANDIIGQRLVTNNIVANVTEFGKVTVGQLIVNSNLTVYGDVTTYGANDLVISDHLIYINHGSNSAANPDLGIVWAFNPEGAAPYQHGGIFRDASDGVIKFFQHYTIEPDANIFLDLDTATSGFEFANIQATSFIGNVIGVVSSIANHTTDNLAEGTNQYFTNVRVLQAVDPRLTTANVTELNNQYFTNVRVLQAVDPRLTTANVTELDNLYFTNARVLSNVEQMSVNVLADVDITGVQVNATLVWDGTKFVPGSTDVALRANFANSATFANVSTFANTAGSSNVALLADNANLVLSLSNFTTANLTEGTNLYFTNTRARTAFLPGKGIAISGDGVITNTGAPFEYNTGIDGSGYANVLSTMSSLVRFVGNSDRDRFLLRSLHITNVSENDAVISGNVLYATGNTAFFANLLPVPADSAVELMLNTQLFQPNDIVNLQGFTSTGTATSNLLQAVYTYETFSQDTTYRGTGQTLAASNTDILVYDSSTSFSILESIKVVNLDNRIIPVRVYWADANNNVKAHLAFNTPIPPNSSFETISTPKRISTGDRIFARFNNAPDNSVSIFLSARLGYNYAVSGVVSNVTPSGTASVSFSSSESDGTLLYYTIE